MKRAGRHGPVLRLEPDRVLRNFISKRHFPIHKIFERSCEIGLWRMAANKISEIFGGRITKKMKGKLNTTLERIEHGHHIFRAYWKNTFIKQYEKFSTFQRNEACSNNLTDFGLKKGLSHLDEVRKSSSRLKTASPGFRRSASMSTSTSPFFRLSLRWVAGEPKTSTPRSS